MLNAKRSQSHVVAGAKSVMIVFEAVPIRQAYRFQNPDRNGAESAYAMHDG